MIGLGKWKFSVNTFLFKGEVFLNICEKDGKYIFIPEVPGYTGDIEYTIVETRENGNRLQVVAASELLPGNKTVSAELIFDGNKCSAKMDLPYVGRMELDNGVRVG